MQPRPVFLGLLVTALAAHASGCGGGGRPDLSRIYDDAAALHHPDRNPVIVIPGILGSRLVDPETDTIVWGAFGGGAADPSTDAGARLVALPMREGAALSELADTVRPDGVLDRVNVRLAGLPIELDAYRHILATLGVGGYRDEEIYYGPDHFTCFQFDYDWRRDVAESAARLDDFIREKRAYVQGELARRYDVHDHDVRFDIVAHSMGGLVARYYMRYGGEPLTDSTPGDVTWAGAAHVDRVIMVGTPNAGSAQAIDQLVHGAKFGPTPAYTPAILGTMPAVYQLMPRGRHGALIDDGDPGRRLDPLDPELWADRAWGLADPRQDKVLRRLLPEVTDAATRRRIALDHQRRCLEQARRLHEVLDRPAAPPPHVELFLLAGDAMDTPAVVSAEPSGRSRVASRDAGDGVVLRSSALLDERVGGESVPYLRSPIAWSGVTFLFTDHLGLTMDPSFSDNVLFILLEQRPARLRG